MTGPLLSARERFLLRACLCQGADVRDAFAAWHPFANPAAMQGRELRLMPMLLASLRREGIDDPILPWLRGHAKHIWLAGALRMRTLRAGLDTLQAEGMPVVLLKGAALLARWRGEAETRPMGDFDLLVPRELVRNALADLHTAGWHGPAADLVTEDDLQRFHALAMLDKAGNALDIHWRPAEAILDSAHADGVFARSVEASIDGRRCRVAGLTDHLFVLLAHALHNQVAQRCDWVAEAEMVLRCAAPDDWDWPLFLVLCRQYRLEAWARRSLSLVSAVSGRVLPSGAPHAGSTSARWAGATRRRTIPARSARPAPETPMAAVEDPEAALYAALARYASSRQFAIASPDGLDFGLQSGGASFLGGWSVPEQGGRWSDGDIALMALRVPGGQSGDPVWLRLHARPYLPDADSQLDITVWAGDGMMRWHYAHGDAGSQVVAGRLLPWRDSAVLPLWLRFDGLMPAWDRVRLDRDPRKLGIFLRSIVAPHAIPRLAGPLHLSEPAADLVAVSGWSGAEPTGRWSLAAEAQLLFRLADTPPAAVELLLSRCYSADARGQRVHVLVNGKIRLRTLIPGDEDAAPLGTDLGHLLTVSLPDGLCAGAVIDLRLRIAAPVSPLSLGRSRDGRRLGIQLREVRPAA